jgi:hypothetical protein
MMTLLADLQLMTQVLQQSVMVKNQFIRPACSSA